MAEAAGPWGRLLRVGGLALVAVGVLMGVAILLHLIYETVTPITASEVRPVAAHIAYALSGLLVVVGLPGLWVAQPLPASGCGKHCAVPQRRPTGRAAQRGPFTRRSSTWEH
jgi:hypothetical protein